jgi:hypothetical protein
VPDGADRGAHLVQDKKRRPFGEDRRSICSRLPRDHPPRETPLPEGTLFASLCLYHKPPTTATDWTRFALGLAGQHADPPSPPVEGCTGPLPRSAARTRPDGTTTMGRERLPWGRSRGTTAGDTATMRSIAECGRHPRLMARQAASLSPHYSRTQLANNAG